MGDDVLEFECQNRDLRIYVVKAGERICIYGSVSIVCLAGNATLNDYNLKTGSYDEENLIKVSAPERMGIPAILQVHSSNQNYKHARLKFRLKAIEQSYERIMELIGDGTPAVFVFNKNLAQVEETMGRILPNFLLHSQKLQRIMSPPQYMCKRMDLFIYPENCEKLLTTKIDSLTRKIKDGVRVSILPIGHKSSGKSNFLRSLTNRLFSRGVENVYILDGDIGQSEFTPCGCMTLTKINGPIFDKPHGHQKTNLENCYFYGDITVSNSGLYIDIMERLWNTFVERSEPGSVCLINSMGWIEALGRHILIKIAEITKPDLFVEVVRDLSEARFEFPRDFEPLIEMSVNDVPSDPSIPLQKKLPPALVRAMTTIGYFSPLLVRPIMSSILETPPFKLAFSNATFCIPFEQQVEDTKFFASINTQIFAICSEIDLDSPSSSSISTRRLCENENLPKIAFLSARSPAIKCCGFAIVRAVSLEKKEIYLMSPVDLTTFEEVPVLVKGTRIQTPEQFFTEQQYNRGPYVLQYQRGQNVHDELYQAPEFSTSHKRSRRK